MSSNKITMNIQKVPKRKYKKFNKKSQALKSITNETQRIYALDNSSVNATKSFIVSDDETIFNKIINGENFFNENIEKGQEVAFGVDMDITHLDEGIDKYILDDFLSERIEKIILFFKKKFNVDISFDNFLITKSKYCTKRKKHSFHMKILGYKFPCPYAVRYYFDQMGFSEEKDGMDSSVYRTGLMRLTFCSKKGQKRPLLPYYLGEQEPDWFYELNNNVEAKFMYFKNSKWSYVNKYKDIDVSEYIDYLEEKNKKNEIHGKDKNLYSESAMTKYTDEDILRGSQYDAESILELINIIDVKRFSNYKTWMKLLWILRNQHFDCFDIFNGVSSRAEKYEGIEKTKKIWDASIPFKYPYTIATLKFWAKNDNIGVENNFTKIQKKRENFDKGEIKRIIRANLVNVETEQVRDKEEVIRSILRYLNKFFIKLKNLNGKVLYLEHKGNETIMRDKKNFLELLEDCNIKFNYVMEINEELVVLKYPVAKLKDIHNAGRLWVASPLKRDVQNIIFYPDENKKFYDTFNMFKGIPINKELCENIKYSEETVKPLQEHILNIWCKGDEKIYDYTTKLLAFYLQNLNIKSGVAIVISGDKGTGKSCVIEKFLKIYGDYGKIVPKLEDILGNFNSTMKDALMVYINEATFTGDRSGVNKLRNLITAPSINVNEKYLPQYSVESFSNFIIDGNGDQLVCNHGEERRFLILETDNKWKGVDTVAKTQYFKKILDISPEAMACWLYNIDLTNFNPRGIPVTEKVKDTRIDSFDPHESFFYNLVDEGVHKIFTEEYPVAYLYDEFLEYTKTIKYQINRNKFGREITKKLNVDSRTRKNYDGEKFSLIKLKSVEENKKKFEELFGELKWN